MKKFRVELLKFKVISVTQTEEEISDSNEFLENQTGDTILAIIHAEDETEAHEKAEKLAHHLKTGSLSDN